MECPITPEREEAMSLSQAYLNNKIVIMTKEGVTVSAKEDLANYNIGHPGRQRSGLKR